MSGWVDKVTFVRFAERAKEALVLAQEEALRFVHSYIGTEHLLVGLVAEGNGVAARVLGNVGLSLPRVREAFAVRIGRGDQPMQGDLSWARADGRRQRTRGADASRRSCENGPFIWPW
jgi:ATP-dependent Clp protease ATP-binding subunit ClpA